MARPRVDAGGGFPAMLYVLRKGRQAGGLRKLYSRLRSRNVCKTCALGMGGQRGGMVDESGRFPSVCKKSVQAQASDMAGTLPEEFFGAHSLAELATFTSAQWERQGRLAFPVIAEPAATHFRRVGWHEALDRAGYALRAAPPREVFFYTSGRSSNEAAFLLQLVARAFGTPNIHNCSFYCHAASGVALARVYGSGTASVTLEDVRAADLAVVAGANPASNHPRLMTQLVELRRRGGKVLVINPMKELGLTRFRLPSDWRSLLGGSQVSDLYLQPNVGSDVALFKALLKGLLEAGGADSGFIAQHTAGFDLVEADLRGSSWDELLDACGVPRAQVDQAVGMLLQARRGIFMWAMGLTHHVHGVDNILALSNLALARGWLGRPGCGLLPIRGHSNVQGVGSVGVTPGLKRAFAAKLEELYGISIPATPGQDTYASMVAAAAGRVRAAVLLGGNLYASNPDLRWAAAALSRIGTTVSITTKLNEGHVHGRGQTAILLPVLARDEEAQATTQESMFNFVRLSDGGEPAVQGEMRSEVDVIASLAERVLPPSRFDWTALRDHHHLRQQISKVVPGYQEIAAIDESQHEFQIAGRTFHAPRFATADGRARFHVTPIPEFATRAQDGEFRLMTLRSEGQFNTVVYEEEDVYRGNARRDVVMMSEQDALRLGLAEGSRVTVETEAGWMAASVAVVDLPPGNIAMYYPEANVLVPRRIDPQSKTPAFKSVKAKVKTLAASASAEAAVPATPR
jgi:molybdopterin-dependent oxidoreductase alpha subunit